MCSECLPVVTCDFEPSGHVPRTSARAHTCAVVFGRAPRVPRSLEHEKRPAVGREKNVHVPKITSIHSNIYISVGNSVGLFSVLLSRFPSAIRDMFP